MNQFLDLIRSGDFVVLDTETTGLDNGAEICQIAIVDSSAKVLLNSLVKPVKPIPADATAIHGITVQDIINAPTWRDVSPQVQRIIEAKNVVIYNAVFDCRMMHQSAEIGGTQKIIWRELVAFHCAMLAYAEFWGDWSSYHQSYRWQTLSNACSQQQIPIKDTHTALGDCLATLLLVKHMAKVRAAKEA